MPRRKNGISVSAVPTPFSYFTNTYEYKKTHIFDGATLDYEYSITYLRVEPHTVVAVELPQTAQLCEDRCGLDE